MISRREYFSRLPSFFIFFQYEEQSDWFLGMFLLAVLLVSCNRRKFPVTSQDAKIVFEDTVHDFGVIPAGKEQTYDFVFHNAGSEPLVIYQADALCHCEDAEYDKEPVKAGGEGKIRVTFHGEQGATGHFDRSVRVYSNGAKGAVTLTVQGNIQKRE